MGNLIVLIWVVFIFAASVFFGGASFIELIQNGKLRIDKGFWLSLSACAAALLLCLSIGPAFYRVYHDELVFISQSWNILFSGSAGVILKGSRLHPEILAPWTANPKLPGFACLEAVVLFLTKDFTHSFFIMNIALGVLSVALVYRIVWLLTASHALSWWSAVFLACLPVRITYSMSAASDIAGLFFFLLFLLFIVEYRGMPGRRFLYAAIFCGIFSVCIKPFYGILTLAGLAVALSMYRRERLLDRKAFTQAWVDIFCLFLPVLCAVPVMFLTDEQKPFSLLFVGRNLQTDIFYLFSNQQNTFLTAVAAAAAVGTGIYYRKGGLTALWAGWLVGGLLIISVFYAGGISYPGHAYSDRYFLPLAFPFVFLAAQGMVGVLTRPGPKFLGTAFFLILIISAFYASKHLTREAKEGFHYQKTLILKQVLPLVPDEAYMLDACSALIATISSKKSIQTELFIHGDHPKEIVFLKGIADDLYNSDEPKNMALVKKILKAEYRCEPLTASPVAEPDLSATPFLCVRK
ncbi:MAG: glycosyltransferase family 39 protein [Candidatus Omnitrophica bacterium]|nr:glycosyltransferase family 39 protein [Candidatus Omnitrophota bacterium]MDE2009362.1 glycosyltransferase family 39 protein [Candidatus Omnitrophota bacterium]MDE2214146.1 glycosyltransferase family 39 protein [Candidatus Omnitrophota bacterium]MDE2231183.1 glycosyltransferase family 39 protein [Candidatus Omnitrophota bacterium]